MTIESSLAEQPKFGKVFSAIPKFISITASLIIPLSIIHEYAYFLVIGQEFITIYSATDFLKLSVFWVPLIVIIAAFGSALKYYDDNTRFRAFASDPIQAAKVYKYPDLSLKIMRIFLLASCVLGLAFVSLRNTMVIQMLCLFILIYFVERLIISGKLPITNRPIEAHLFYTTAVILLTAAFFGGLRDAIHDLDKMGPSFELQVSNPNVGKSIIVLRAIEKGVLFREAGSKKIVFAPWDDIKQLQSPEISVAEKTIYGTVREIFGF